MAENVQETRPPEPPPKPPEVPKPAEADRMGDKEPRHPPESQVAAHGAARDAAQTEHAAAMNGREPEGLRPTPEFQAGLDNFKETKADRNGSVPPGEQASAHGAAREAAAVERGKADGSQTPAAVTDANVPGAAPPDGGGYTGPDRRQYTAQHLDTASDLRQTPTPTGAGDTTTSEVKSAPTAADDTPATDDTPAGDQTTSKDQSPEVVARMNELRDEGHGPQRHHDPTDAQLVARLGDPVVDGNGEPELKPNGYVRAENKIDPMTGTSQDGVHGGMHRCGDYATRFNSAEDYVAADNYMRQQIGDSGADTQKLPISDVLGPDGHDRLTGYYHDPASPGQTKPVDFTGGNIVAIYDREADGTLNLRTMYADPDPTRQGVTPS